jgi:TonB family protein
MKYPCILLLILYLFISPLKRFFCQEVVYPERELKEKIEGTVLLTFMVDSLGSMSGLLVKQSVSPGLDKEAIRLMAMSIWTPAYRLGRPISTFVDYPIKFNIKKYKKHCKKRGFTDIDYPYLPFDSSNTVYSSNDVDKAPKAIFDDPDQYVSKFIMENLKYPEEAFRQNISGEVVLSFIVETNGLISHIIPEKPLGGGCTQEAIRIVELLKWMPGIKNNMAVRSKTNMKIIFKLAENQDLRYVPSGQNQGI